MPDPVEGTWLLNFQLVSVNRKPLPFSFSSGDGVTTIVDGYVQGREGGGCDWRVIASTGKDARAKNPFTLERGVPFPAKIRRARSWVYVRPGRPIVPIRRAALEPSDVVPLI